MIENMTEFQKATAILDKLFGKDFTGYCVTFPEEKVETFPYENYIDG